MGQAAQKIVPGSERRLREVSLSLDGRRIVFLFESGEGYAVPRPRLPGDDGSSIVSIQLSAHRQAVSIYQASGSVYELPWDSIKHYALGGRQRKLFLGGYLHDLRRKIKMTQMALARSAGMSRMQLFRLEKGRAMPSAETLVRLAHALGVPPQELLPS